MQSEALITLNKIYELGELSNKVKIDEIPRHVGKYEMNVIVTTEERYDDDVDLN
jgi:hypothetical protein